LILYLVNIRLKDLEILEILFGVRVIFVIKLQI